MSVSLASLAKKITALESKFESLSSRLPAPEKPSRFIDNGDGTITDKETNLTWMQQDDGNRRTWEEAKTYCEELKLAGGGWRLPTVKELIGIVDYDRCSPAIDPLFLQTQSSYYWSSTPYVNYSVFAWGVGFGDGFVNWDFLGGSSYVRPVRQNS